MLYFLHAFHSYFSPLNVFQYITFRSAGSFLTALGMSLLVGPAVIRRLSARGAAQTIRADGPPQHHAKTGTPTMGGLIIYFTMLVSAVLWARLDNRFVNLFLIVATGLWLIGFVDDYLKSLNPRKQGLSPSLKMTGQLVLAFFAAGYLYHAPPNPTFNTLVSVPYSKEWAINLGVLYVPFSMMMLVG